MEDRIVISFREPGAAPGTTGRSFLERARALESRVRLHGAVMVAWDGNRVSFAFDEAKLPQAIGIATVRGEDTVDGEVAWCVGVAQGDLTRLVDAARGDLAWGPPLVAASLLAGVARPGEVLLAPCVKALRSGELLTEGHRVARDGSMRVRGARLDTVVPWRRQAVEHLSQMRVAPLVGAPPAPTGVDAGSLLILRADPGTGGSRYLAELAARASRALVVLPAGSSYEPLGALRRALARSTTRELSPLLLELTGPLEALLAGEGVSLDMAARLVTAFLWPKTDGQTPGLLLLDDAKHIDPATLEACVRAAEDVKATFGIVARLDATGGLPSVLAALTRTSEIEIAPLNHDDAQQIAAGCTSDALDAVARRRWARLAANVPLGVVESVAYGIVSGDLRWGQGSGAKASPRSRTSGRGKVRAASDWISVRARGESRASQLVLCLIALLGGEAKVTRLAKILERAGERIAVEAVLEELMRGRWLVDTQEDWVALPSRTHREALAVLLDGETRRPIHRASADVIQKQEGVFGRVEAGWHATQVGDGPAAARILIAAARATAAARLEASTTQLIAFARRADPSCEEAALELLANALERAPSNAPPRSIPPVPRAPHFSSLLPAPTPSESEELAPFEVDTSHDSEPPTIARIDLPPKAQSDASPMLPDVADADDDAPPVASSGANIAVRLGELAKEALLSADNAALERWVDGLTAAGESPMFTERLRALSRLGRGDIGDALRVLRRTRSSLDPSDHKQRCQTSLALGVALSVAGRPQEALLEGMDALARARHAEDEHGAIACLAFLAKLYTAQGREEVALLRAPIRRSVDPP